MLSKSNFLYFIKVSIAFFILPALGIYLSSFANIFYENISYIGNIIGHQYLMYLWGCLSISYFYFMNYSLLKKIQVLPVQWNYLLFSSCILMIISILLPYHPELYPFLSQCHIYTAFIGTIPFIFITFFILFQLTLSHKKIFRYLFFIFQSLLFICIFIIFYYGMINSLVEILFSSITAILLCIAQITYSPSSP